MTYLGAGPCTDAALFEKGEDRHTRCIYSELGKSWSFAFDGTKDRGLVALCTWANELDAPPWLLRAAHGAVEFERDCAVCPHFAETFPDQT